MNISARNHARILATVKGTATNETGIYGSKFFALLRCIDRLGEPIETDRKHDLRGLKALQINTGQWLAVKLTVYQNGYSMCKFYLLETISF